MCHLWTQPCPLAVFWLHSNGGGGRGWAQAAGEASAAIGVQGLHRRRSQDWAAAAAAAEAAA